MWNRVYRNSVTVHSFGCRGRNTNTLMFLASLQVMKLLLWVYLVEIKISWRHLARICPQIGIFPLWFVVYKHFSSLLETHVDGANKVILPYSNLPVMYIQYVSWIKVLGKNYIWNKRWENSGIDKEPVWLNQLSNIVYVWILIINLQ